MKNSYNFKSIVVIGRKYSQKKGCPIFSSEVLLDGVQMVFIPEVEQTTHQLDFLWQGWIELNRRWKFADVRKVSEYPSGIEPIWVWCERNKITLNYFAINVATKRDLRSSPV